MGAAGTAVLLSTKANAMADWAAALREVDPTLAIRFFPEAGDPAEIEAAVVWTSHDMAELRRYPNLRLIVSMGAGVDHLLRPPGPPPGIPVARLASINTSRSGSRSGWPSTTPSAAFGCPGGPGVAGAAKPAGRGSRD